MKRFAILLISLCLLLFCSCDKKEERAGQSETREPEASISQTLPATEEGDPPQQATSGMGQGFVGEADTFG